MLRRTLAVVLALAGSATLASPASGASVDHGVLAPLATTSYGPGYSPAVKQEDSYYPDYGDPRIDVLSYDLKLTWNPGSRTLAGTAGLVLRATGTSPQFQLDLGPSLSVSSVKVGLVDATFTHDGKNLVVDHPIQAGQKYQVTVAYSGTPRTAADTTSRVDVHGVGWHTTKDGQVWTMQAPYGASTWYPANDMPADKAMYTITLDVPDKWIGISNGTMTSRQHPGSRLVTTFKNKHPMAPSLTTVAIGPYRKYTQTGPHGLPMTYWYPRHHQELLAPLKTLPGAMTWLEGRLGRYPFESAGVVLTPSESSRETQTMITFGVKNYRYGNRDVREQLVHQLVHSWYGDSVTPTDWRDLWMNEGMATLLEAKYSVSKGWKPWRHWRREFFRNDAYWREIYGPPGAYSAGDFGQINVSYSSARMLLRLRGLIGVRAFSGAIKAWPQQHLDQGRGRADYVSWLQKRTGKKLAAFFDTELDDAHPTL